MEWRIGRLKAERERNKQEKNAEKCCGIAEYALKHFNRTNKGTEYELLSDHPNVTSIKRGQKRFEHGNFLAKPRGAAEDEIRLFFAELQVFTRKPFRVTCCRVLGPEGVGLSVDTPGHKVDPLLNSGHSIKMPPEHARVLAAEFP